MASAADLAAAACSDGLVEAVVCGCTSTRASLPCCAHGPARARRVAGAAGGAAAVDGSSGAGCARTSGSSGLRPGAHRLQLGRRLRGAKPGYDVAGAGTEPDAVRLNAGIEEQPGAYLAAACRARGTAQ